MFKFSQIWNSSAIHLKGLTYGDAWQGLNLFLPSVPFLYPLKMPDVFLGYRNGTLGKNGLKTSMNIYYLEITLNSFKHGNAIKDKNCHAFLVFISFFEVPIIIRLL